VINQPVSARLNSWKKKQDEAIIREACEVSSTDSEKVSPANFNEPSQIVISGDKPACERAIKFMEEKTV
jgi:[acyl-carrier-protein] S-malonyltransferase